MKTKWNFSVALVLGLLLLYVPARGNAQSTGSIEFTAHVTPTDGRPQPARAITFYVLTRSLNDIRNEVAQLDPAPDLDTYVDHLTVSPELKTWMKKNHTVQLSGGDFTRSLTADTIVDTPEFYKAYMSRNAGFQGIGFPKPKYKEKDRLANPEKFAQLKKEYLVAVRKFIIATPESIQGIEADLGDSDASRKWDRMVSDRQQRVEKRTLDVAQTRYVIAQADTNLDGQGTVTGVAPGEYWLGTLGTQAIAGDVRLRWDTRVAVRPGETTRVNLTNLNALAPRAAMPNRDR